MKERSDTEKENSDYIINVKSYAGKSRNIKLMLNLCKIVKKIPAPPVRQRGERDAQPSVQKARTAGTALRPVK